MINNSISLFQDINTQIFLISSFNMIIMKYLIKLKC
jgi:hypothetical protein